MEFWIEGAISDHEMLDTLEYVIQNDIIIFDNGQIHQNNIEGFMTFHKGLEQEIGDMGLITNNPTVHKLLASSNADFANNPNIGQVVYEREGSWHNDDGSASSFALSLQNNELSQILFEELDEEQERDNIPFSEIHVTNSYGVTVAQTGVNSDYVQSDEHWWVTAVASGIHVEYLEYDEHSGLSDTTISIKIESDDGDFLGVLKAEIDAKYFLNNGD